MASFYDLQFSNWMANESYWRMNAVYNFPNGYGISVAFGPGCYGVENGNYEVAILKNGYLCFTTDLTNDVIGNLDEDGVTAIMAKVEKLESINEPSKSQEQVIQENATNRMERALSRVRHKFPRRKE